MVARADFRIPEILVTRTVLDSEEESIPSILVTSYFTEDIEEPRVAGEVFDNDFLYPPQVFPLSEADHSPNSRLIQDRLENIDYPRRSSKCDCSVDLFRCLEESIQCPVCYDSPRGYIFQCEFGHVMCAACRNRLRSCPVCRVKLIFPIRNLALEKLAKLLNTN